MRISIEIKFAAKLPHDRFKINPLAGSSGSVQSWASSLSADSQSEEAAADFMKAFVPLLFDAPNSIDQEQKANFGQMVLVSKTVKRF